MNRPTLLDDRGRDARQNSRSEARRTQDQGEPTPVVEVRTSPIPVPGASLVYDSARYCPIADGPCCRTPMTMIMTTIATTTIRGARFRSVQCGKSKPQGVSCAEVRLTPRRKREPRGVSCKQSWKRSSVGSERTRAPSSLRTECSCSRRMPGSRLRWCVIVERVPIGKGMAGLAAERNEPVSTCNIQSDNSGNVNAGAKQTGCRRRDVVPIRNAWGDAVGCTRDRRPPRAHVLRNRGLAAAGRGPGLAPSAE